MFKNWMAWLNSPAGAFSTARLAKPPRPPRKLAAAVACAPCIAGEYGAGGISTKADAPGGSWWDIGVAGRDPGPSPTGSTGGGGPKGNCGGNGESMLWCGCMGSRGSRIGALNPPVVWVRTPRGVVTVMILAFRGSVESSMRYPGGRNVLKP